MSKTTKQEPIFIMVPVDPTTQLATSEPPEEFDVWDDVPGTAMVTAIGSVIGLELSHIVSPGHDEKALLLSVIASFVITVITVAKASLYQHFHRDDELSTALATEQPLKVPNRIVDRLYWVVRKQTGVELADDELQTVLQEFWPEVQLVIDEVLPVIRNPKPHDKVVVAACKRDRDKLISDIAASQLIKSIVDPKLREQQLADFRLMMRLGHTGYDPWKEKEAIESL